MAAGAIVGPSIVRVFGENGMRGILGGRYFANRLHMRTRARTCPRAMHSCSAAAECSVSAGYNHNRNVIFRYVRLLAPLVPFESRLVTRRGRE